MTYLYVDKLNEADLLHYQFVFTFAMDLCNFSMIKAFINSFIKKTLLHKNQQQQMSALIWQFEYLKCMLNKEEMFLKMTNRDRTITIFILGLIDD